MYFVSDFEILVNIMFMNGMYSNCNSEAYEFISCLMYEMADVSIKEKLVSIAIEKVKKIWGKFDVFIFVLLFLFQKCPNDQLNSGTVIKCKLKL